MQAIVRYYICVESLEKQAVLRIRGKSTPVVQKQCAHFEVVHSLLHLIAVFATVHLSNQTWGIVVNSNFFIIIIT